MGFPDLPVRLSIISRLWTLLRPPRHMNAAVPFLHLSPSRHPRPSTLAQCGGQCQGAATSNADEKRREGREGGSQMDRCRAQKYNAGRNMIGHQSKTELVEKKLSLKLIIYPGEEKPQPHPLFPLFSAPSVAWCQLSTLHQCLHLHAAIEASFCRSRSKSTVYLTGWQHTQKLH